MKHLRNNELHCVRLEDPGDAVVREMFAKALPRMSLDSLGPRTIAARQLVRSEVWRRLDHVE